MDNTTDNSKSYATKLTKSAGNKFERICESLGTNPYNILQQAATSFIKFADMRNALDENLRKLMNIFFSNLGQCEDNCSLADPNAKADILATILFIGSHKRKEGKQMVMVDEPFMGKADETWNVQDMVERVMECAIPTHYRKFRRIVSDMGCNTMLDAIIELFEQRDNRAISDQEAIMELFSDNDRSEYGVKPQVQPFKRKHAKHIANYEQQTIRFEDDDKLEADMEANGWKPIGAEG